MEILLYTSSFYRKKNQTIVTGHIYALFVFYSHHILESVFLLQIKDYLPEEVFEYELRQLFGLYVPIMYTYKSVCECFVCFLTLWYYYEGKIKFGTSKVMKRPLWELNMKKWCFQEEGGIDVVWGLRCVFVLATILETIVNQNYIKQVGFNAILQTEISLLDTQGKANIDSLFVLLLILPLQNEGILLNSASIRLS